MKFLLTNPTFTNTDEAVYRNLPAWNNSGLGDAFHILNGNPKPAEPKKAWNFGAAVHKLILEPDFFVKTDWDLTKSEWKTLYSMADAVEKHAGLSQLIRGAKKELVCTRKDRTTRLNCKIKIDVLNSDYIIDLKTTSAADRLEFLENCEKYEYHRQAAFYCDLSGRDRFLIIGIQKRKPFNIFYLDTDRTKKFFQTGQKRYKFLLEKVAERGWKTPAHMYTQARLFPIRQQNPENA